MDLVPVQMPPQAGSKEMGLPPVKAADREAQEDAEVRGVDAAPAAGKKTKRGDVSPLFSISGS